MLNMKQLQEWARSIKRDVRAELVIFCGPPAPDHRECCPIVLDLYIKYPPNPRSANDRQNQALLADWLNNNCAPPNRKRR